ncbi:hypothetical protein ACWF9G_15245 [Nocardia sp. NPDC055029]
MSHPSGHDPNAGAAQPVSPTNGLAPATVRYGHDHPLPAGASADQRVPAIGYPSSPAGPAGAMPGVFPGQPYLGSAGPGQPAGEWWQSPATDASVLPGMPMAGYPGHQGFPGAQTRARRSGTRGALTHRAAIALAVVLAGVAAGATVGGFRAIQLIGSGYPDDTRRVLAMTLAHLVAALLWVVAALLLARRVKAGRAMAGVLAVGYLALNVLGLDSIFTIMLHVVMIDAGWGGSLLFDDESGRRIAGAAAVLAALMLILMLVSAATTRTQGRRPPQVPSGFAGQPPHGAIPGGYLHGQAMPYPGGSAPGQVTPYPGAPSPHHPYR